MGSRDGFVKNVLAPLQINIATDEPVESGDVFERAEALDGSHADLATRIAVG
jgi:hypothetical protein